MGSHALDENEIELVARTRSEGLLFAGARRSLAGDLRIFVVASQLSFGPQ